MSEQFHTQVTEHKHFEVGAWIVVGFGILLWLALIYRFVVIANLPEKGARRVPVVGSSDMIRRAMAINDAIERGESTYTYQTNQNPAPMQINNQENK